MKHRYVLLALSLSFVFLPSPSAAGEKRITRKQLPPAVEKAVADQSKGATIKGFAQEIENGKTFYEAEMIVNGHSKDVLIDPAGTVVEVEEQVELNKLPAAVQDGLKKAAGAGTITKIESLTKDSKLVAYEAAVKTGSKHSEAQVGPDGKKLAHSE